MMPLFESQYGTIVMSFAVTIYHTPRCGTSRNTLAAIRDAGHEPQVVDYLANPPTRAALHTTRKRPRHQEKIGGQQWYGVAERFGVYNGSLPGAGTP